jgi:hypothetical protein
MASRTHITQDLARLLVESFFARLIGGAVYRADRRDPHAMFEQLLRTEQAAYERIGTFVMRLSDESHLRAGLYAGADALVQGGIGSLSLKQRAVAVGLFTRGFLAMKEQMNGTAAPDVADLMRALVEADGQAGISHAPVQVAEPIDLATVPTSTTEVM